MKLIPYYSFRDYVLALVASFLWLAGACAIGQTQAEREPPTLLVVNTGLHAIGIHDAAGIMGRVQPSESRCFRLLWSGWDRLSVRGIGWRYFGPRFNPSERRGWVWEIGLTPSLDVRLNLVPGERC